MKKLLLAFILCNPLLVYAESIKLKIANERQVVQIQSFCMGGMFFVLATSGNGNHRSHPITITQVIDYNGGARSCPAGHKQ